MEPAHHVLSQPGPAAHEKDEVGVSGPHLVGGVEAKFSGSCPVDGAVNPGEPGCDVICADVQEPVEAAAPPVHRDVGHAQYLPYLPEGEGIRTVALQDCQRRLRDDLMSRVTLHTANCTVLHRTVNVTFGAA